MDVDLSLFRNNDISAILNRAASICIDLGFNQIEPPVFFMSLQQEHPYELKQFMDTLSVDEEKLYNTIVSYINECERDETDNNIRISTSLLEAFNLAIQIENAIPQLPIEYSGIVTALFTVQGPLRQLGQSLGVTTQRMQDILTKIPSPTSSRIRPQSSTLACNCPTVEQFCTNWLEKAREGAIEPAIGRDEEIKRVLQILSRRTKNNPVLVGEPGTGKTAVVEGLAHRLLNGEVPEELSELKLYQLDLGLVDNLRNGDEVMRNIIDELKQDPLVVLFIDEIHTLVGANSSADNPIANLLKPEMARGTIKIIGATTLDEYSKHIEKDKAFERRFQKVSVEEPDVDTAIIILKGIKERFERHHHVIIPDSVVECAVKLSHRYISDRRLPDKAIDLLDEAASCVRIDHRRDLLTDMDIMEVVTNWTGIPMQNMSDNDTERLRHIEENLHNYVIGQDKAICAVANAIRRSRMGFNDASRPIGSFLFLGTTGVGKTELCKALAQFLFHSRDMIVRIDMSEYQQEHSVARLFGAPPGYIGYEQGGQLTEAVRRKPYSLVLFDEIEKAHPKIFETLLQVLDDGRMTDGQGRVVDFKNTIIVMTSNMGQDVIMRNLTGKTPEEYLINNTSEAVLAQLKQRVAPEFINRIDNIVMFLPLTKDDVRKIAELQLRDVIKQLATNGIRITFDSNVLDYISEKGYQPEYGGRPVKRVINSDIKDVLSELLINGDVSKNLPINCYAENNSIRFQNN